METFLKQLLSDYQIERSKTTDNAISKLVENAKINDYVKSITQIKQQIIDIFAMYKNKEEFKDRHITIENANAKMKYDFIFDLQEFPNIVIKEIRNLDLIGLQFNADNNQIFGTPAIASTVDLQIVFYDKTDENKSEDIKIIPFIVNADPKDLWQDKPSDKNLKFAKEDSEKFAGNFLDKKIVVASKRGRSHAHEGLFRDDHFCVKKLPDNWGIIAVADGAGSARYSRQGSKIATEYISESFDNDEILTNLSVLATEFFTIKTTDTTNPPKSGSKETKTLPEDNTLKIKSSIINILYKSVRNLHSELVNFAKQEEINLKDLNTTLIFALVKKFDFGYVTLTFGVGDCPINVISQNFESVKLLNTMDVGEFGGGTRFITMPEIFNHQNISSRFNIQKFDGLSKLFLMTDGIYDPKFVVESKLEDLEAWKIFIDDLNGQNEDALKVDFKNDQNISEQLLQWLDFWSKGNHDDRTLAIIY